MRGTDQGLACLVTRARAGPAACPGCGAPLWGETRSHMAIPFALVLAALRRTGPARVGMLSTFEIVATSAIAYLWIGQTLTLQQCVGCLLVVVGVGVCSYYSRPERPAVPAGVNEGQSSVGESDIEGEPPNPRRPPRPWIAAYSSDGTDLGLFRHNR
jgi:hypothetical protein